MRKTPDQPTLLIPPPPQKKGMVHWMMDLPPSLYVSQMQETKQPTPKPSKKKTKMDALEKICALIQETTTARKDTFHSLLARKEQSKLVKSRPTRAEAFGVYVGSALEAIPPQYFSSACQDIQTVLSKYDLNY